MSRISEMKAQLATIKAKKVTTAKNVVTQVSEDESSWLEATADVLGAVPSSTIGFFSNIGTSFKYHEAKRQGKL